MPAPVSVPIRILPETTSVIDAHVHFWDPGRLRYPWLDDLPALARRFGLEDFQQTTEGVPLAGAIFVECNCAPEQAWQEVEAVVGVTGGVLPIVGMVAFADLTRPEQLPALLDRYAATGNVKGIRHNIQGTSPGFCLREEFVQGVLEAGRRGFAFDLCATHDQLADVVALARACPGTRFVLDHCGKPCIRERLLDPWRADIRAMAGLPNVWCKLSGLLTEASAAWDDQELAPYAGHVVECFGVDRVMYGGDWPVLTLAGTYHEWYQFTRRFTSGWGEEERAALYRENALQFYGIL